MLQTHQPPVDMLVGQAFGREGGGWSLKCVGSALVTMDILFVYLCLVEFPEMSPSFAPLILVFLGLLLAPFLCLESAGKLMKSKHPHDSNHPAFSVSLSGCLG